MAVSVAAIRPWEGRNTFVAYGDRKNDEGLRSTQTVLIKPPGSTRTVASNTRGLCESAKITCDGILGLVLAARWY